MYIKGLKLKNFRNYKSLDISFSKALNIIYGDNAQGKTNIIEAIFFCASGRSHRTSKDSELLKDGSGKFDVALCLEKNCVEENIEISYSIEEKKKIRINEIPVKKIGDLMGHLNAVIFSPEDLMLVKQGPAERRRFIDITLSQIKPAYFSDLQQYARILCQRNMLLKNMALKKDMESTIDVWDKHLAKCGTRIIMARRDFIEKLSIYAKKRHSGLSNNEEDLSLEYNPSFEYGEGINEKEIDREIIENTFIMKLERNRLKEIQKGNTTIGPHRDDVDIVLNGQSTKIYGSQGQQRTTVLSMKLAEIELMKEECGSYPVLLLDDVLSELDEKRKAFLLENIEQTQTFITCTDIKYIKTGKGNAKFYYVSGGNVVNNN